MFVCGLLVSLVAFCTTGQAYKILVYGPKVGHSHVNFMGGIADTLVSAGHDVVFFSPEYNARVTTNGSRLAKIVTRRLRPNEGPPPNTNILAENAWAKRGEDVSEMITMIYLLTTSQKNLSEILLTDDELLGRLRAEKFDVGISEVLSSSGFALFDKIGLRSYIAAFATNLLETITHGFGIDNNPSYVPASFSQFTDEMTYWQRAANLATYLFSHIVARYFAVPTMLPPLRKYIRSDYDIIEVVSKSTFVFVNADEFLEFPRPINHKVVYIGGNAVPTPKPLNQEYQRIMESAVGGAVLISFGSIAKSSLMTNQTKNAFVNAFKAFPEVTFIWKYEEDDEVAADLPNVYKRKWVPQNDLLGHGNMRAFVSHGGLNSVTESVHSGVPIVCIPLFGDQMRNAKMVEKRGVAVIVDKMAITEAVIADAFKSVLYNKSYRTASRHLLSLIKKKPFSARERIIRHTEFAAEFGEVTNLDPVGRKLNFFQYYLIDIIVPFLLFVVVISIVFLRISCLLMRKLIRISKAKTD